jgi:hypothetical protein
MKFNLVSDDNGNRILSIFADKPYNVDSTHPEFDEILRRVLNDDESAIEMIDMAGAVVRKFDRISERVSISGNVLYLDGEPVHNSLAKQVIRFLNEGVDDWKPLVNFFENVQQNPNAHSREQLYDWLMCHDFTITESGHIVGYKGVRKTEDGSLVSGYSGRAIVDGQTIVGNIPNNIGSVVEMPRNEVAHDPSNACSYGLHVGTYSYAHGYANGAMLEVHVNPRDVVSVPTDAAGEKVRCCRYRVAKIIDAPETVAVVPDYDDYDDYAPLCNKCHYGIEDGCDCVDECDDSWDWD